jgi:hypothetical protein
MRLLVVTARFPTADRPAAGAFVRERLAESGVDAVVIAPGIRHKVWAADGEPLRFLCCCAPAYSHEDTVLTE